MREILDDPSPQCSVSEGALFAHFHPEETKSDPPRFVPVRPPSTPTPGEIQDSGHDLFRDEFTTDEVLAALKKTNNIVPGPDRIRYQHWKRFDSGCHILARLFNCYRTLGQIPESWKTSRTVLIHKGEDLDVACNWRPISLICTVAKLYSSLVAKRLMLWTTTELKLSPEQKGFMPFEGCLEGYLTNAVGSVPHTTIRIAEMYRDNMTSYLTQAGLTSEVSITKGVRQGCPLSPIVFNFAILHFDTKAKDNGYWMQIGKGSPTDIERGLRWGLGSLQLSGKKRDALAT